MELLGSLIILAGAVFLFAAGLGIVRMPDSYNRIQAGTKASTLGTMLVLVGVGFFHPDWAWKMLLLILFVFWTNPVSSHALARAAHRIRIATTGKTVVDRLKESEQPTPGASPNP